jgi:hypothetical protein
MPLPRLSVVAVVAVALSCGGGSPQPAALSQRWVAPSIMSHVPAESPYLFAVLEPISDAQRRRMMQGLDQRLGKSMKVLDELRGKDGEKLAPWQRAIAAFAAEVRGKDAASWFDHFGLDPRGRFALYGMSVWPVARLELADPARLRAAIERIATASGAPPPQHALDGHPYWQIDFREFSLIVAVLDREAVAAFLPRTAIDAALPEVLGLRPPAHSLAATSTVPDLLARHHLLGVLLGYFDARNLIDIVTGAHPGPLDAPLRRHVHEVSAVCRGELDHLAAIAPRLVLGYRRFDDTGFDSSFAFELAPVLTAALRKLHAAVPEVTSRVAGHPLVAMGAAVDPDQLLAWLGDVTRQLHDHPFQCPWFTDFNDAGNELASKLATPLPPTWRGLRGFAMTIDDAALLPPTVTGHVLVAGDHVADLVQSLAGAIPQIAGIPLTRDGRPVALPTQQLGLPVPAHFALTANRLVIAAGTGSERRAAEHLTTPPPSSPSPLLVMAFDVPRLQKLLAALGQSPIDDLAWLRDVGFGLDVDDAGLSLDFWGSWQSPPPAQIAAPPAAKP